MRLGVGCCLILVGSLVAGSSAAERVEPTRAAVGGHVTVSDLFPWPADPRAVVGTKPATPRRLIVPSVGLNVRVRRDATPAGGVVRPASYRDAYWLASYAAPSRDSDGTAYLAGHSSPNGTIVFDAFLDSRGRPRDLDGQEVTIVTTVGKVDYRIEGKARVYAKNRIAQADEVWRQVPGRLLLITCDQADPTKNAVFFAQAI